MWKCGKCGCKIVNPDIPLDKWVGSSCIVGHTNSHLMHVYNVNKTKNVWICTNCFEEFCKVFHSRDKTPKAYSWIEAWTEFIGTGLKFAYTQIEGVKTFVLS